MSNYKNNEVNKSKNKSLNLDKSWLRIWTKRGSGYKKMRQELAKDPKSFKTIRLSLKIKFHDFLLNRDLIKYWMFLRNLHLAVPKYLNVLIMIFVFFTNPKKLYKYSWRKSLPPEDMKNSYSDNLFDLFKPEVVANFDLINCKRSIYMRGYEKEIPKGNNIILVNSEITNTNKHCTFVSGDESTFNYYLENEVDCIFLKLIKINKNGFKKVICNPSKISKKRYKTITLTLKCNNHLFYQTHSSAVMTIFAFALISSKLKVYGWNFYKKKKLSSMNFVELIWNMFFFLNDYHTKVHVEYSLTHLFYSYYFNKIKNIKIEGNLDYFKNDFYNKIITPRLKSIFLN